MRQKLFLLLTCLLFVSKSKSQQLLDFKPYDTTAYVYSLDKAQMDFMVKGNSIKDTSFLFTHLYKKFSRNSNYMAELLKGNYIIATIDQAMINYQYYYVSSFEIKHKVIGNDVVLFIKDKKTRANLSDASVKINGIEVPFSAGFGGYAFNKNSVDAKLLAQYKAFLQVQLKDEYLICHYGFSPNYQQQYRSRRFFTGNQSYTSTGYVISDKPIYRPGDTLRIKAFLSNPLTGKPHKRRANFYISETTQNFLLKQKLKAVSPGAFVFEWKIPDTLKIDRTFQMNFNYRRKGDYFNYYSTFYLENYELGSAQYNAYLLKQEFFPNEDIAFRVQAEDANGFPLQGTMIHYKLSLNSVQDFFGDTLTISAAKRANFYEHDTIYPYENKLDLKIPSHLLPNMDAGYGLEVTITDPNTFEQKKFQLNCTRIRKTEKLLLYQEQDSLFVRFLYNGRDTAQQYQLTTYSNGDTLSSKLITTPYRVQLSPYATLAQVNAKEKQGMSINLNFNALAISKVKGLRSADSIRIAFSFPFDEAIYYRILKKDKVVQQGKTKQLNFKIADASKDPYTIIFSSNINNAIENNFYRITYVPPLHKIKLKTNLPAQTFPGKKLQVQIEATDCYNKPLEHVNIAAFAINKQFSERYVRPTISVPEEYRDLVSIAAENSTDQAILYQNSYHFQSYLNPTNFSRFDLKNNDYYRLRYPENEYSHITKKIQSPVAEFAISVTANHIAYTPKYILLDGRPVYISDLRTSPYSFQASGGKHQIKFRFSNKTITLNDVSFDAHTKNWLGFNIDSISTRSKKLVVVDSLPIAQPNDEEKALLYSSILLANQFRYDSLVIQSATDNEISKNKNHFQYATPINVDGDYLYVFGPFEPSSTARVFLNRKEFNLKLSTDYVHFYNETDKEFTSKLRGPVKGAIFAFVENQISDAYLANLYVQDTVAKEPEKIQLSFDPYANNAIRKVQSPEYSQNYNSGGQSYFTIYYKDSDTTRQVKAIWLINKKQPEFSDFRQITYRGNLMALGKNGAEGMYDIYFLMNNQNMLVLRDHRFNSGDALYINPGAFAVETLNNDKLSQPLKVYTDLTKLPLLPFYFPPEESNENIKELKDQTRKKTYVHGYITNEALQPLSNVMVMAELNGKFMYGAMTNNVGEFEILDMVPGSYQLKLYNSAFQMKTFTTRFFKAGYSYEINSSLKDLNLKRPVLESIQKDFRFMVFNGDVRKNLMKLNVYDKDTREALNNFTISVKEISNETAEKTLIGKEDAELQFLPQVKVYNIEVASKGYVPVVFHNIRFCKNSFYALYLFMLNEKDNQWAKKKEYDLGMQYYSATEEIGATANTAYYSNGGVNNLSYSAGSNSYIQNAPPLYNELSVVEASSYKKFKHKAQNTAQHGISEEAEEEAQKLREEPMDSGTADISESGLVTRSDVAKYAPDNMINQVINMPDLSQTRKNFNDVGFWQPNLLTNKKGQVNFEIRLPDNITTWKSNVLAMGDKHLHGMDTSEIRAYKPLQVSAIVPAFMWKGDKVWARARYANLTEAPKTITGSILINNAAARTSTFSVKNDAADSLLLDAKLPGPLVYKASLQYEEKYKDEEQREIMVYNPAFRFYTNRNFSMDKDSTYRLEFENGTKGEIILNNSLYEKINEEIKQLTNYEYTCVEQTSSQLKALLCKEKINRVLGNKENLNPSIYKLIHQLDNYQNKNGTWGWWKRQSVNWRMTIYAVEALGKAKSAGYNNNSFSKGVNAIKQNFATLSLSDQLYAYSVLQSFGLNDAAVKRATQAIKIEELSTTDKLYYYKIKEADGGKVNYNDLYAVYLELNTNLARPYYGNFFYEPRATLFEAYNLFSNSNVGKEWVELFKTKLLNGQLDYQLNTYAKAALIEALTSSTGYSENKPVTAEVIINDTLKIKNFPYRVKIARTAYQIKHRDAAVFVNTSEEKTIEVPIPQDSLFKVKTSFVQNGKTTSEIKAGVPCQMNIDIDAYRSYDYVMIEIPVPSGMRFVNKTQLGNASVEYFTNKVVVFYQRLNMQQHHLSFEMMPVFKGSFTWPAAKCSLMYYPYLYGNNENKKVEVR